MQIFANTRPSVAFDILAKVSLVIPRREVRNGGEFGCPAGGPAEQRLDEGLGIFFRRGSNPNHRTPDVLFGLDDCVTDQFAGYLCHDQVLLWLHPRVFKIGSDTLDAFRPLPVTMCPDIGKQSGQCHGVAPFEIAQS